MRYNRRNEPNLCLKVSEVEPMQDKTMTFSVPDDKELEMRKTLTIVYDALKQKGYNPISQIVGYIL